ncbi:MAG: tetratricopeptide repeat protein [Betaproteobacteria bacterium]
MGALTAARAGSLADFLRQRRGATRWFARRHLQTVLGTAGDALAGDATHSQATAMLMRWAASRLRPDLAAFDAPIDDESWLERTSWRPFLAIACHFGLLAVPRFDARYRRSAEESAAENLCGLWNVGPSTFYRYLDKARRAMAQVLQAPPTRPEDCLSLRESVHGELLRARAASGDDQRAWHRDQAAQLAGARDPCSTLWHALQADEHALFVQTLQRFRSELAGKGETDALIERLAARTLLPRQRFDLHLAEAALWRTRNAADREYRAYEHALRHAAQGDDKLLLGIVYGSLGWYHESRDVDRALACFEESADLLRRAELESAADAAPEIAAEYVSALVRLAWLYVLRNDPRSRTVLDLAEGRRATPLLSQESVAMLEQAWGEYWRRARELRLAISFKHKALNIFERLGDTRQMLSTYNNLSLLCIEAKDYERALDYARRVVATAETTPVDSYVLTSALGNLGIAYFWLERFDDAIDMYRRGLSHAEKAGLRVIVNRAHYNLAEAHFKRFQAKGDPADERAGDHHVQLVITAPPGEREDFFEEAAPSLKAEVLGEERGHFLERMKPEEVAAHFHEMKEVQRQRAILAVPGTAADHVRAHLAIAHAYVAISGKEREAAIALIQRHGLGSTFEAEIDALGMTFSRGLTREKSLLAQWKQKCYGVLTEERITPVLRQVMATGSINKSGYAELCQVGLATASKHLGTLTERGLLTQMGKGPSTRYVLP